MKYRLTPDDEEDIAFQQGEQISMVGGFAERYYWASLALQHAPDAASFYAVFVQLRESARFGVVGDDTLDFRVINAVLRQLNEDIDCGRIKLPEKTTGREISSPYVASLLNN